jgi:hypothetical protein
MEPPVPPEETSPRRLLAVLGVGPFLVNGGAGRSLRYGVLPSIFAGYTLDVLDGRLTAGALLGLGRFTADGLAATSRVRALPLAAEARFENAISPTTQFFARLSAGGSVLQADSGDGWVSKMVPYTAVSFGGALSISEFMAIGLDVGYSVIWEREQPLAGFTPAASLISRF